MSQRQQSPAPVGRFPHFPIGQEASIMANFVLLLSSVSSAFVHMAAHLWYQQQNAVLTTTMACGIATSVWNHGVTSSVAKIADRVMMWIGFFSNLHSIWNVKDHSRQSMCLLTLLAAALLYSIAKALLKWRFRTHVANAQLAKHNDASGKSSRRLLPWSLPDLAHAFAHCSLTVTHVLLMEAYSPEFRVGDFVVQH